MQIAEILSTHVQPGALVIDLTLPAAELSAHTVLPPGTRVGYRRELTADPGDVPELSLVLQQLPAAAVPASADVELVLDVGYVAKRVVHVIFFDRVEAIPESGLLERAAEHGFVFSDAHATGHEVFRFAVALTMADQEELGSRRVRLRTLNEYRFGRLQLREQQAKLDRWGARIEKLNGRLRSQAGEIEELRRERERLGRAVEELTVRAEHAESWLLRIKTLLEEARHSMSFRVAYATRGALRDAAKGPRPALAAWLRAFNRADDALAELERELSARKRRTRVDGGAD